MQNDQVRVSAIMPVYNVAGFVRRAVESMLAQDLKEIELICVDDGSTDGSSEILDQMAKNDPRMKVLHQKNAGAAAARNAAIAIARGEYLYFVDGDDWAESDMLRRMVQCADETRADMVMTGFYIETYSSPEKFVVQHVHRPDALMDREEFRRRTYEYCDSNLLYPPWNKLFRTDVVMQRNIRFRDMRMDDFPFNLDYIRDIDRVAVMDAAFYHFTRARSDSETQRYFAQLFEKREDEHGWLLEMFEYWQVDNPETWEMLGRRYVERLIGCFENVTGKACPLSGKEKRAAIRRMMQSPYLAKSLADAKPRSLMMKILLLPVRARCVEWAYWQSRFISFVRRNNGTLFARLKASR